MKTVELMEDFQLHDVCISIRDSSCRLCKAACFLPCDCRFQVSCEKRGLIGLRHLEQNCSLEGLKGVSHACIYHSNTRRHSHWENRPVVCFCIDSLGHVPLVVELPRTQRCSRPVLRYC